MKYWPCCFLFLSFSVHLAYAQKVNLEKWVKHTVDSLRKDHIDSIEYYHAYCGECEILKTPGKISGHTCDVGNGWVQIANIVLYKQKDSYFSLTFDCGYPPVKKELKKVNSIEYFLSIVPVLNERDKTLKEMYKHFIFPGPSFVDGGYEEAIVYVKGHQQKVAMQENEKTSTAWRTHFWIDKQTKLLEMLESETSLKY